jgi:hypothetical protein
VEQLAGKKNKKYLPLMHLASPPLLSLIQENHKSSVYLPLHDPYNDTTTITLPFSPAISLTQPQKPL